MRRNRKSIVNNAGSKLVDTINSNGRTAKLVAGGIAVSVVGISALMWIGYGPYKGAQRVMRFMRRR